MSSVRGPTHSISLTDILHAKTLTAIYFQLKIFKLICGNVQQVLISFCGDGEALSWLVLMRSKLFPRVGNFSRQVVPVTPSR